MLTSALTITVLYSLVALVLFRNQWKNGAPTQHRTNTIHDIFSRFSWGRFHRASAPTYIHPITICSGGPQSVNPPRSIRRGSNLTPNQVSGRNPQLKTLAIKMLWYPIGMHLPLLVQVLTASFWNSLHNADFTNYHHATQCA